MNIELTTDITAADLALLENLYEQSFPVEERRPWALIAKPSKKDSPKLFAILADGHIAGMLTLWTFDHFAYIEHLAVNPDLRGKGVGSEAIREIAEKVGMKPIVVEIEPPTDTHPDTLRRHDFYSRLGFQTIATDYIQPPYAAALPSVPMHLLATAIIPVGSTAATLHHEVYGQ